MTLIADASQIIQVAVARQFEWCAVAAWLTFFGIFLAATFGQVWHSPPATAQATATPAGAGQDQFLAIVGPSLVYKGEKVKLQGVNHNNLPALCSRHGQFNFGSCKISDINLGEDDYRQMNLLGINHVRFGLSYNWFRDDRDAFFSVLDQHVAMARRHRLWIVWNLFTTPGNCYEGYAQQCPYWTNAAEQAALKEFWVALAKHYADEPVIAAYGLLNEPTPPALIDWLAIAQDVRNAMTAVNPRAIIAVGATSSSRFARTLKGSNILYEVHDYLPTALTHASDDTVAYPGSVADWDGTRVHWDKDALQGRGNPRANLRSRLSIEWAHRNSVPLYIGEWGTTNAYKGYVQFVQDRSSLYTTVYDVHHAFFVWRSDAKTFGLYPYQGALVPFSQDYLDAAAISWRGARRPGF